MALAFNLIGEDARKREAKPNESWKSRNCDLQSAGYRILIKPTPVGAMAFAQFGFKLYSPLTSWNTCEVSVLIDSNEDGLADQELAGVSASGIEGFQVAPFATALLDASKARAIRLAYETALADGKETKLDYKPAILNMGPMAPFTHSTLAVIEIPLDALAKTADGKLNVKVATLSQGGEAIESDDFLGDEFTGFQKLETTETALPYYGMSEFSAVGLSGGTVTFTKGSGSGKLVIYYPFNAFSSETEKQQQILE